MKSVILAALALTAASFGAQAQNADPAGTYLSETKETQVRIAKCGAAYCGTIIAVTGEEKDVNNADASKRGRNLVGSQMLWDIKPADKGYSGQLYNYKDGKTYSGTMAFEGKIMKLAGCVFGGLICRSQTWTKTN